MKILIFLLYFMSLVATTHAERIAVDDPILIGESDLLAGRLLILQAYGSSSDAAGASHSFVELYNASDAEINLSGISLFYADGTSVPAAPNTNTTDGEWKVIPLSGTLPAKTSFLILGLKQNTTGRLQITENSGDINNSNFTLSNRAFKVALIHNKNADLLVQNPFDMDGAGAKADGYIDMIGAANAYSADGSARDRIFGFEIAPARNSASEAVRRKSTIDTDVNNVDFESTRYAAGGINNEQLEIYRPKNLAFGAWNPVTGYKDGEEPTPIDEDPIVAGQPDALAGKLLILQAYGSSSDAAGVSHSFVELYNNTDASINLIGITLFFADGTSVSNNALPNTNTEDSKWKAIPLSGTLPAKTSFLILGDRQNATGRLQIQDNYGDINDENFTLSNRAFKVALIRNKNADLTVQNPFDMDGADAKADGYIDMIGAANAYSADGSARDRIFGFETAPARNSASEAVRRKSSLDTNVNNVDFESTRYAAGGVSDGELEIFRPKNRVFGSWNPFTGETLDRATALPIVRIYTENEVAITSRDDYTSIVFSLTDPKNPENNVFSNNPRDEMRGRGNATWNYPKKPYRVRFRENTSLFGLDAHRNWIMLAEFRDPMFMTTPVVFELGGRVFDHQPHTNTYRHVHLYFNGKYDGVYILTEHRQASPDGIGAPGRVGIDPLEGWLVQMSIYDEAPMFMTRNYNLPILIQTNNAPDGDPNDSNNPYYDFIKNDWNNLCDMMVSSRFPENGYRDLIDMDSFIDYIMIHEIVANTDGIRLGNSVFAYKDKGGKISLGPLWDFDISFGWDWDIHNHVYFVPGTTSQFIQKHSFFRRFFDDPVFFNKYKERWSEKYLELSAFSEFIEELGAEIRPAILQDSERWAVPVGYVVSRYNTNHAQLISEMAVWWNSRITWLNNQLKRTGVDVKTPTLESVTNNSVTVKPLDALSNGQNVEYLIRTVNTPANFNWRSEPSFADLSPNRTYYVFARSAENENFFAGAPSAPLRVNTLVATTGLETQQNAYPFNAFIVNGLLHISGLATGETFSIYNATGALIFKGVANGNETLIPLHTHGLYIIQAGNRTEKLIYYY